MLAAAAALAPGVQPPRLSTINKLSYSLGMLGYVCMLRMMSTWLQKYLVPPDEALLVVDLVMFGLVMGFGRTYIDSVTDPVIGYWSDHSKSRYGRRKPFILAGAVPTMLSLVGLFALQAPDPSLLESEREAVRLVNGLIAVVLITVYFVATTLMAMAYLALLPEITPHPTDRKQVSAVLAIMIVIGVVLGQVIPGFMPNLFQASLLMTGIGVVCFVFVLVVFREPEWAIVRDGKFPDTPWMAPQTENGEATKQASHVWLTFADGMRLLGNSMVYAAVVFLRVAALALGGLYFLLAALLATLLRFHEAAATSLKRLAALPWLPDKTPEPLKPLGAALGSMMRFRPFIGFMGAFIPLHASFVLLTGAIVYIPQALLGFNDATNYQAAVTGQSIPAADRLAWTKELGTQLKSLVGTTEKVEPPKANVPRKSAIAAFIQIRAEQWMADLERAGLLKDISQTERAAMMGRFTAIGFGETLFVDHPSLIAALADHGVIADGDVKNLVAQHTNQGQPLKLRNVLRSLVQAEIITEKTAAEMLERIQREGLHDPMRREARQLILARRGGTPPTKLELAAINKQVRAIRGTAPAAEKLAAELIKRDLLTHEQAHTALTTIAKAGRRDAVALFQEVVEPLQLDSAVVAAALNELRNKHEHRRLEGQELGQELINADLISPEDNQAVLQRLDRLANQQVALFLGVALGVTLLVGIPVLYLCLGIIGKRHATTLSLVLFIIGPLGMPLVGLDGVQDVIDGTTLAYLMCAVVGISFAGIFLLEYMLLADVIELDAKTTGERRESLYYGINGLLMKIAIGGAIAVNTFVFDSFGYSYGESLGVRMAGPISSLVVFLGALLFWRHFPKGESKSGALVH